MTPAELLHADTPAGIHFLSKLRTSEMIKIRYILEPTHYQIYRDVSIHIPSALACAVSARFRDLCESNSILSFEAADVLGEPLDEIESGNSTAIPSYLLHKLLYCFIIWLYTGRFGDIKISYHFLWLFGQKIGSPHFQNDVVRCMANLADKCPCDVAGTWQRVQQNIEFNSDDPGDVKKIRWNKHALFFKYELDATVWHGEDEPFRQFVKIVDNGGKLATTLISILFAKLKAGSALRVPWDPENLEGYLLDEDISKMPEGWDKIVGSDKDDDKDTGILLQKRERKT